jgi:hypothetical protein
LTGFSLPRIEPQVASKDEIFKGNTLGFRRLYPIFRIFTFFKKSVAWRWDVAILTARLAGPERGLGGQVKK